MGVLKLSWDLKVGVLGLLALVQTMHVSVWGSKPGILIINERHSARQQHDR